MPRLTTKTSIRKKYGDPSKYTAKTVSKAMIADFAYLAAASSSEEEPEALFTEKQREAFQQLAYDEGYEAEYMNTYELIEYLKNEVTICLESHRYLLDIISLLGMFYSSLTLFALGTNSKPTPILKKQRKEVTEIINAEIEIIFDGEKQVRNYQRSIRNHLNRMQLYNTKIAMIAAEYKVPELATVLRFDISFYTDKIIKCVNSKIDECLLELLKKPGEELEKFAYSERGVQLLTKYPTSAAPVDELIPTLQAIIHAKAWNNLSAYVIPEV